jgi:hypothetical protein
MLMKGGEKYISVNFLLVFGVIISAAGFLSRGEGGGWYSLQMETWKLEHNNNNLKSCKS